MLSATSHIGLEFLTKFLNMSKLQNRLILLYVPELAVTYLVIENSVKTANSFQIMHNFVFKSRTICETWAK